MRQRVIVENTHGRPTGCLVDGGDGQEHRLVVVAVNRRYANEQRAMTTIELHADVEEREVASALIDLETPAPERRGETWPTRLARKRYVLELGVIGEFATDSEARKVGELMCSEILARYEGDERIRAALVANVDGDSLAV